MTRLACLALSLPFALSLAACGDNLGANDAGPIDARPGDDPDAAIDASPPVAHSGTVSLMEVQVIAPGGSGMLFGQGLQASISFTSTELTPAPLLEEQPGSPLGCKAWSFTAAQAAAATVGLDEGPVQFTATAGTTPPVLPACTFTAGVGYTCPQPGTASTGGTIASQGPLTTLTDANVTYTDANSLGRYVTISGAAMAANNGVFPIVARPAANVIAYGNTGAVPETLPAAAVHANLAAVGPIPSVVDPGFLADDVALTIDHAAGGGNHIAAFTATTGAGTVGDDFSMVRDELLKLNGLALDGTAFTIACEAGSCAANSASGTILNIVTTDGAVAGLSPFAMPLPATRRVQVRCAAIGQTAVTVPAAYAALLRDAGATRVQSTFARAILMQGAPASTVVISGHAVVGFTNR